MRLLQMGEPLSLPHSRPMPSIAKDCPDLRINDKNQTWRIIYWLGDTEIAILEVFSKKTNQTQASLAELINSSQSHVAKMESADQAVSIDLLVRSLFALNPNQAIKSTAEPGRFNFSSKISITPMSLS